MGLFSKKPKAPASTASAESEAPSTPAPEKKARNKKQSDAERVQAELDAMKERLVAAERSKADLEARLRVLDDFNASLNSKILILDEANAHLDGRLDAIDHGVTMLGGQLDTLTASNDRVSRRLLAVDDLDARVGELTERLESQKSTVPTTTLTPPPAIPAPAPLPPAIPAPAPTVAPSPPSGDDGRLDDLSTRLELLAAAVAAHTEQIAATQVRMNELDDLSELIGAADERLSSADARITSVSTELANQLTELSRDIDELNRRSAESAATDADPSADVDTAAIEARLAERLDAAIDDVLDTTEKLAAEQARYEIQFRADLAELAERLRRPGAG